MNSQLRITVRLLAAQSLAQIKQITAALQQMKATASSGSAAGGLQITTGLNATTAATNKANAAAQQLSITQGTTFKNNNSFTRSLQNGTSSMLSWGKSLQSAGRQLAYNFTYPIVNAGKQIIGFALENERALTGLKKVYGDGADGAAQFAEVATLLGRAFQDLSNIYGVQQSEVIDLAAAWAAAGATGYDLAKATQTTIKAMKLGDFTSTTEAVQSLIAVQTAYRLNSNQLEDAINSLNAVENETAVTFTDLVRSFVRVGSVAQSSGVDIQHLSAMIAALVPTTGSAETAGNGLKTILTRMMAPTSAATAAMKDLGIEFQTAFAGKNATERLEILAAKFKDLDDGTKVFTATQIAGRFQANRFIELMKSMVDPASAYARALDASSDSTKTAATAQREINAILQSSPQAFKILQVRIQNMLVSTLMPLIPTLLQITKGIESLVSWFNNLSQSTKNMVLLGLAMLAVVGPIARISGAFVELGSLIAKTVGFMGGVFIQLILLVEKVGLLFLNPWVLLAAALVGGLYLLYHFRDEVAKIFSGITETITKAFYALPKSIQNAFLAVVHVVSTAVKKIVELLSYLNPFARHSPSLVDQVDAGVDHIAKSYAGLAGIGSAFAQAADDFERFKKATAGTTADFAAKKREEQVTAIVTVAPGAQSAVDALFRSVDRLTAIQKELTIEYSRQEAVVNALDTAVKAASAAYDEQNDILSRMKDRLGAIGTELDAAKQQLQDFANAPIAGMKAMDEQIFQNSMDQKALRLELLRMQDAGGTIEDLTSKIAAMNGEIESLRGRRQDLILQGAGSDVLGFYDEQIAKLQAAQKGYKSQIAPIQAVQDQLDQLGRKAEELDLERSLRFDPLTHQIQSLVDTTKELTFDEIVAGIRATKPKVDELTQAYDDQKVAIDSQQIVVDQYKGNLEGLQRTYDNEKAKLDDIGTAYDEVGAHIQALQSRFDDMASSAVAATSAAGDAAAAAGDFDTQDAANLLGSGGSLEDFVKELDQQAKDALSGIDFLGPIKAQWKKVTDWWGEHVLPDWNKLTAKLREAWHDSLEPAWNATVDALKTTWQKFLDYISGTDPAHSFQKTMSGFNAWFSKTFGPVGQQLKSLFTQIDWTPLIDAWHEIQKFGKDIATEIAKWKDLWSPFVDAMKHIGVLVALYLGLVIETFKTFLKVLLPIITPLLHLVTDFFEDELRKLHDIIKFFLDLIAFRWKDAWGDLVNLFKDQVREIGRVAKNIGPLLLGIFKGIFDGLGSLFMKINKPILDMMHHGRELMLKAGRAIIGALWDGIVAAWHQLWNPTFSEDIIGAFGTAGTWLKAIGSTLIHGLINGIKEAFDNQVQILGSIPGRIIDFFKDANRWLIAPARAIINGLIDGLQVSSVGNVFRGIKDAVLDRFTGAADWLRGIGRIIVTGLETGITTAIRNISGIFTTIRQMVLRQFSNAQAWLTAVGGQIISGLLSGITTTWGTVTSWFSGIGNRIAEYFIGAISWLANYGTELINGFFNGITNTWSTASNWFTNISAIVVGFFSAAGNWLLQSGSDLINGFLAGIQGAWTLVTGWLGGLFNLVTAPFIDIGTWLVQSGLDLINGFWTGITTTWGNVTGWFDTLQSTISSYFDTALDWLSAAGGNIVSGFLNGITSTWSAVTSWFDGLPNIIASYFDTARSWLTQEGSEIIQGLFNAITGEWSEVTTWFGRIENIIKNIFRKAADWLFDSGRNIIGGFKDGLTSAWTDFNPVGWMKDKIGDLLDLWPFSPAKAGPFRDHPPEEAGANVGRMFTQGLQNGFGDIETSSANVANTVANNLNNITSQISLSASGFSNEFVAALNGMASSTAAKTAEMQGSYTNMASGMRAQNSETAPTFGAVGSAMDSLRQTTQTSVDLMNGAWDTLNAKYSDHTAWLNLQTDFNNVSLSMQTAADTSGKTAQQIIQDNMNAEISADNLALAVSGYVQNVLQLPPSIATKLTTELDMGQAQWVEDQLEILTRNRSINLDIIAAGGAGYSPHGVQQGAFATGTLSPQGSPGGFARVGELGQELALIPRGNALLPKGTQVFSAKKTRDIMNMTNSNETAQHIGDTTVNHTVNINGDLSFPNITNPNDAERFIKNLETLASR